MTEQMTAGKAENKAESKAENKAAEKSNEDSSISTTADVDPGVKAEKQAVAGVQVDHGEKSKQQQDLEDAQAEDVKNYGQLPAQMRPENQEEAPEGRSVLVDGLNPHLTEDNPPVGGTLPPV